MVHRSSSGPVMDDHNFTANRARRESLACISRGIPTQMSRLPGKPTDVATRRRQSMSAAVAHDLDCPAFLRQSFSTPVSRNNSSSPVRGVARTASGESRHSKRGGGGGSNHQQGTSSRLHRSRTTSLSNHARNETHEPAATSLTGHLGSRSGLTRTPRSASMSSISTAQKDLVASATAHSSHTSATAAMIPSKARRRNSLRPSASRSSHVSPTRTRRQGVSRRTSGDGASLGPTAAPSSSPCVYEFDNDDNVEEFAGDNNNEQPDDEGEAWPSPFEADASAQIAPKQRRQDRQRLRHSAAAAASTVLNTRRGRAPVASLNSQPVPRSSSLQPPSKLVREVSDNHSEPHVRTAASDLPFHMPSLGIPLTEPKKEILFTPSSHKRSMSITASDVALTPSLHKKQSSRDATRRAPVSAMAALGSKSMVRSKSMDKFVMTTNSADVFGCFGSPPSKGGPQTPLTATSSDCSKQTKTISSKTLSSRSTRSTVSTSSRDSSSKEGTSKRLGTPRSAPSSRSPLERSKSLDQYKSSDFLMLSPLSALPAKNKAHSALPSLAGSTTPPLMSSTAAPSSERDGKARKIASSREIEAGERKQQNDSATITTLMPSSADGSSRTVPQQIASTRNGRSRRASIGEDGKLHRHMRRNKGSDEPSHSSQQTVATAATGRLRRRQSLSHAPSAEARTGTSNTARSNRRLSMCSSTDVDGGVTAVVTTMSRIQNQSSAKPSDAASIHMMNW